MKAKREYVQEQRLCVCASKCKCKITREHRSVLQRLRASYMLHCEKRKQGVSMSKRKITNE